MDKKNSGVGVLDKAVYILATLESGPHSLAELVAATGIARPTAHRLAVALEFHHLVARDLNGRFIIGPRSGELAAAAGEDRLIAVATPALAALRDATADPMLGQMLPGDQVERVAEGQLKWQVLLIQALKNAPDFKGTLELSFVGTLEGKPWSLSPAPAAQPVLIKSYLRQEGVVDVPAQAVVKTVTAKILQGGVVKSVQTLKL